MENTFVPSMRSDEAISKMAKGFIFKITFGLCFLILYCLPLAGAGAFWFSHDLKAEENLHCEGTHLIDGSHHSWENLTLFRFSPKPKQQEKTVETDAEEDENTEFNKWFLSLFLDKLSDQIGSKSGFIYRASFLQTRRELALFVLHHSWRTFIF